MPILKLRLTAKLARKSRAGSKNRNYQWHCLWNLGRDKSQEMCPGPGGAMTGKCMSLCHSHFPGEDSGGRSYTPRSLGTSFVLLFSLKTSFKLFLSGLPHWLDFTALSDGDIFLVSLSVWRKVCQQSLSLPVVKTGLAEFIFSFSYPSLCICDKRKGIEPFFFQWYVW